MESLNGSKHEYDKSCFLFCISLQIIPQFAQFHISSIASFLISTVNLQFRSPKFTYESHCHRLYPKYVSSDQYIRILVNIITTDARNTAVSRKMRRISRKTQKTRRYHRFCDCKPSQQKSEFGPSDRIVPMLTLNNLKQNGRHRVEPPAFASVCSTVVLFSPGEWMNALAIDPVDSAQSVDRLLRRSRVTAKKGRPYPQ